VTRFTHPSISVTGRPIRWIVTDLDGTLVDGTLEMVPRSVRALQAFRATGGEVFLATGRNEVSAGRYHSALGLDTPAILYNGARVVDLNTRTVLYANEIGPRFDQLRAGVLDRLPPGVGAVAFTGDDAVVVHDAPALADYARRDNLCLCRDREALDGRSVIKVLLVNDKPELQPLRAAIAATSPELVTVSSEPTYLEVLAPQVSKGTALRWLADNRGVELGEIAAIGDNHNDTAMMLAAGLGAAPASAGPSVRRQADLVVGRCTDGAVADLVDYLLARNRLVQLHFQHRSDDQTATEYARHSPDVAGG